MSKTVSNSVVNFLDIDFSKISFTELKSTKYNSKYVNILYDGKTNPLFTFPKMKCPFGITKYPDNVIPGKFTFSIESSFENKPANDNLELKKLLEKCLEFDNFILKAIQKHHNEWLKLKTKPSMETVRSQYSSNIKIPVDKETGDELDYSYRLKSKVLQNMKSEDLNFDLYDENRQKLSINVNNCEELMPKGCSITTCNRINKVWFANKTFGVTRELVQARVFQQNGSISSCVLFSDDEDLEVEEESVAEVSEEVSEEESEEDETEE